MSISKALASWQLVSKLERARARVSEVINDLKKTGVVITFKLRQPKR
jgi:biotin operon repressor